MKKRKWVKTKTWYGYSYSLYLPETNYLIGKIMTRVEKEYDIALPRKQGDTTLNCLANAKSKVINRLKDVSKDLQNLLKTQ